MLFSYVLCVPREPLPRKPLPREPLPSDHHVGVQTAVPRGSTGAAQRATRTRVALGSALCGIAALGLWWTFEQSAVEPETYFAIARTRLSPGMAVEAADIAVVPIRLPAEVAATVFDNHDDALGQMVINTVLPGELLARSDVTSVQTAQTELVGRAVAVELDRPQALNGLLEPGERVDVVTAAGTGPSGGVIAAESSGAVIATESSGAVIATDVRVLEVDDHSDEQQQSATVTVTLLVPDLAVATKLAAAAHAGTITLIRIWGTQ